MTLKRFMAPLLGALLICPPALAQTPATPQQQQGGKSQNEDKELEKKALALLDEIVGEAMSLRLVENRIYVLTTAANLFWKRDEARARALLTEAVNQFMAIEQPSSSHAPSQAPSHTDPDALQSLQAMASRMELRTQLLQT